MINNNSLEVNLLITYYRVQRYRFIFLTIGIVFTLLAFYIIFKSICWSHHSSFLMAAACPLKNGFGIVSLGLACYSLWIACEMEVEKEAVRNTCDKAHEKLILNGAGQQQFSNLNELQNETVAKLDSISHTHGLKMSEKALQKRLALQDFSEKLKAIV